LFTINNTEEIALVSIDFTSPNEQAQAPAQAPAEQAPVPAAARQMLRSTPKRVVQPAAKHGKMFGYN
jgi:cytochrome c peroxidase